MKSKKANAALGLLSLSIILVIFMSFLIISPITVSSVSACECGDSIIDDGEECDNGDLNGQSECSFECTLEPMVCEEGESWAGRVVSFDQGLRKDGDPVTPERSDPSKALGVADGSFVSLGFKGELVVEYPGWATDGEGWDISVHETTWGRMSYPDERVEVYVSQDGSSWAYVGEAGNHDNGDGIALFDISPTGYDWVKYVKVVDITNPAPLPIIAIFP